jgi:peptidyl-prolyl cis-trans isomerase-like 2
LAKYSLIFTLRYKDPFEEYKTRLAKKLAKRAEAEQDASTPKVPQKKEGDDINWFGVKVGKGSEATGTWAVGGGVGKYLNSNSAKRSLEGGQSGELHGEEDAKKRKLGFTNFDTW